MGFVERTIVEDLLVHRARGDENETWHRCIASRFNQSKRSHDIGFREFDDSSLPVAAPCHAAADLAGAMRLEYPSTVRVLRFPCTGKVEPNYLLKAFELGVDGVIVAGCL